MRIFFGVVALTLIMGVIVGSAVLVSLRQYYLARRKGYRPIVAGAIVYCVAYGALIIMQKAIGLIDHRNWPDAVEFGFVFLSLAWVPTLAAAAIVAVLPHRNTRRAGSRSTPFLLSKTARILERGLYWCGVLIAATGVIGLWWFPKANNAFTLIKLSIFILMLPPLLAHYRKRATAPTLKAVIARDSRPPVLYLRAFYQEAEAFTWGTKEQMARYTAMSLTTQTSYIITITFEQYLEAAISQGIGPFVALGNPEDFLPPEGAAREYAEDSDWQQQFLKLAETAKAIVMEVSRSDNLRWEIAALLSHGWQRKLFVITPPMPKSNPAIYRWGFALIRAAKGVAPPRWNEFSSELNNAGFQIDPADPGPGSVVSFDLNGSSKVIARGAADPEEYMIAIKRRLEALSLAHGNSQS
jgi:hypothetical protein